MKANASPLPQKRLMSKERNDRPIDPQPASEGRPGEREVEDSTTIDVPQMGEAVPGASPLAIVPTTAVGCAQSISPFLISPAVQHIFESARWIRPGQTSTWSQVSGWGFIDRRIQIERPLQGNYVTIALDSSNQSIIVSYPGIGEAPPLPSLLLSKNARFSVDCSEVEPQLEEERLKSLLDQRNIASFEQFSNCSAYIGPSTPVVVPRKTQRKEMACTQQT